MQKNYIIHSIIAAFLFSLSSVSLATAGTVYLSPEKRHSWEGIVTHFASSYLIGVLHQKLHKTADRSSYSDVRISDIKAGITLAAPILNAWSSRQLVNKRIFKDPKPRCTWEEWGVATLGHIIGYSKLS